MKYQLFFKLILGLAFMIVSVNMVSAQHLVTGMVTDEADGAGIPGVGVTVAGTGNAVGTVTDLDGKFSLEVSSDTASLKVSYIGYETQIIPINGRSVVDVQMIIASIGVDEVVVIGYGTQKKKVVTGSISDIDSEEISSGKVLRAEEAIQGRAAGVQVTSLSGQPGEAPTVRIRGIGTTGNSNPLYVVDGMPVDNIDFLNPGDIESIDVLKDAASSAIYGARAANGVVLITTKKGTKGSGMTVTYSGYYGLQSPVKTIDMLNSDQYRELMNEGAANAGLTEPFDMNEIALYNTNWQEELFQTNVPVFNHELNVRGGKDKSSYSSSLSYYSQDGIIGGDKSKFDRISGRFNTDHEVNRRFNYGTRVAFSHIYTRGITSNGSFNSAYNSALNLDPLTPVYETDEAILAMPPYSTEPVVTDENGNVYGISNYVGAEVVNPLALMEIQTGETSADKLLGNVYGELEIFRGLKLKSAGSVDLAYITFDSYRPLYYLNGAQLNDDKTSVSKEIQRYFAWQIENTLNYSRKFGDHNVSALAGMTAKKNTYENLYGSNADVSLADPNNVYLSMANDTLWQADGGASHYSLFSVFGRVLYDYRSKYALTAIVRYDGSSKFGPNNRYGTFPSLGVSWAISDEEFMPDLGPVELLKFRASWGRNGNDNIGLYQYVSVMDYSRNYIFGGGRIVGASPQYIPNEDIHWEESEQIDLALDVNAYRNSLTATFDVYRKTTKGLLEVVPIPGHVGNDAPVANVGSVQNQGVELAISWRKQKKDFYYSISVNGAYNQNKMVEIGNEEGVINGATWAVAGVVTRAEEGLPIAYFWGYETDGIFQSDAEIFQHIGSTGEVLQPNAEPGDVRFVDVNNDGVLNEDDRTMIGNPTPDWTFGMSGSMEYKGFDFSFLLTGAYGNDVFNGTQRQDLRYTNRTTAILDRWSGAGTSDEIPRYTWIDANNNYRVSDLYIEDASFLRVKNVQLGYNLPEKFLSRFGSTAWRIYVSVENLYTLTGYTGSDPEIGAMSSFDIGVDRGVYPQARTIRFGTSISF